ncbi:putative SPRY domain contaitning protein [Lyophyllum shimeji]|uniref:SPRY domain contaitning protein n=1 Tax=Lyophyllum shimeji TaxID=47721 RepID=A0A9P3PEJ5_LYOSH|nr:putative SPRY domain contaitning protein [Lyophyllum shimeji]
MPSFFESLKSKAFRSHPSSYERPSEAPPEWAPAPETSHQWGLRNEASSDDYRSAEEFCASHPVEPPRLLPSDVVDHINNVGCRAWAIEQPRTPRFKGKVRNQGDTKGRAAVVHVQTRPECQDTCLLSTLPLLAGLYDIHGKQGVYYEVEIVQMDVDAGGFVAVGTACRPYPDWRLPGWNRQSAGLHLDDMRKFFEDPDGGRDYLTDSFESISVRAGDTIGCGYEFSTGSLFFTYNGLRLPNAFKGVYLPRAAQDVYAAVGVSGGVEIKINFGGDVFRWKEGNEWAWRVEGHVGRLGGGRAGEGDELPTYSEASSSTAVRR